MLVLIAAPVATTAARATGLTQLTTDPASDGQPSSSPDGKQIVFRSDRAGGVYEIYAMNADGSNETQLSSINCAASIRP